MTSCLASSNNIGSSKNLEILTSSDNPCVCVCVDGKDGTQGACNHTQMIISDVTSPRFTNSRLPEAHLSPPRLDHEFSGEVGGRLGLQGPDHNGLIQRIPWYNLAEETMGTHTASRSSKGRTRESTQPGKLLSKHTCRVPLLQEPTEKPCLVSSPWT